MSQSDAEEEILTAVDILEEEKKFEDEASALFGNFEDNGYMKRQPLYSCLTCRKETNESAGVCLACSLNCHEGHNLIELYTKRNFKCDCGNTKFKQECQIFKEKDNINILNQYNHNFEGMYCNCNRPYPDPDNEFEEEMIQCIICEDWLHINHLNFEINDLNFEEFVCQGCVSKHKFLLCYKSLELILSDNECKIKSLNQCLTSIIQPLFFAQSNWREKLCCCIDCKDIYEINDIKYIVDHEDTLEFFTKSKEKIDFSDVASDHTTNSDKSQYEHSLEAFSKLDKISQNEMLHHYNEMSDNLKDYLKNFAESGKVVKKDDILGFFDRQNKKQKILTEF